jgi:hypothetical protein
VPLLLPRASQIRHGLRTNPGIFWEDCFLLCGSSGFRTRSRVFPIRRIPSRSLPINDCKPNWAPPGSPGIRKRSLSNRPQPMLEIVEATKLLIANGISLQLLRPKQSLVFSESCQLRNRPKRHTRPRLYPPSRFN